MKMHEYYLKRWRILLLCWLARRSLHLRFRWGLMSIMGTPMNEGKYKGLPFLAAGHLSDLDRAYKAK